MTEKKQPDLASFRDRTKKTPPGGEIRVREFQIFSFHDADADDIPAEQTELFKRPRSNDPGHDPHG